MYKRQVDEYIPEPERDTDKPLLLPVEDVFSITGRGTVASGRIDRGVVRVNDEVEIVGLKEDIQKAVVTGVETVSYTHLTFLSQENVTSEAKKESLSLFQESCSVYMNNFLEVILLNDRANILRCV